MTANYFESTVKYMKVNEDGREKKVSELYLIDAIHYKPSDEIPGNLKPICDE